MLPTDGIEQWHRIEHSIDVTSVLQNLSLGGVKQVLYIHKLLSLSCYYHNLSLSSLQRRMDYKYLLRSSC